MLHDTQTIYELRDELELTRDVQDELAWEPSLDESQIAVAAKNGVVTLTGRVPSLAQQAKAEEVAKRIYGVRGVANHLTTEVPPSSRRSDADIAEAVQNALHWFEVIPDHQIQVSVVDGWVTLTGNVEKSFQRDEAEQIIHNLTGVRGVTNLVAVKSNLKPYDVKKAIQSAFKRSAEIDARRINVETNDGKVILRGHVRSWSERKEAQRAASAAPGVNSVENWLAVIP
jgi:osmotically-inducible protein OsmY